MNILAIETATSACALGVRSDQRQEIRVLDLERRHTEVLAAGIAQLLEAMGLTPRELDRVVVDLGPGLFTGLRVGVATAIGLGEGLDCPLVGVTSLELLAHGAQLASVRGTVVCAVDGRRGEVFVQTFRVAGEQVVALGAGQRNPCFATHHAQQAGHRAVRGDLPVVMEDRLIHGRPPSRRPHRAGRFPADADRRLGAASAWSRRRPQPGGRG